MDSYSTVIVAGAYHEAGHAVWAYHVGWRVSAEGVEIEPRQHTGLSSPSLDRHSFREIEVSLAGWLSEHRHHGRGARHRSDDDLDHALYEELAYPDPDEDQSDDAAALKVVVDSCPRATDRELFTMFRECQDDVWRELCESETLWPQIEHVAAALIEQRRLTAQQVERLLRIGEGDHGGGDG